MTNKTYKVEDLILPGLDLPDPCPVRVEIRNNSVFLYVGSRDWQWDYEDESLVGCGTRMADIPLEKDNGSSE